MNRAVILIWLFCAVFLPLTLYLGFWQLGRADEKQQILTNFSVAQNAATRLWQGTPRQPGNFLPYRVSGQFTGTQFLLDNRTRFGRVGYEVLALFELDTGAPLLVNRGWVPAPRLRSELPTLTLSSETMELSGYFYASDAPQVVYPMEYFEQANIFRIQSLNWEALDQIVENDARSRQRMAIHKEFRLQEVEAPVAFDTDWPLVQMGPEKHEAYAWQWFSLSVALVILTLVSTVKLRRGA